MTSREQGFLAAVAVAAIVAVVVAAGVAAFAVVRTQRQQRRIDQLESQVRTLCARRVVTGVTVKQTGRFTVQTASGC